MISDIFSVKGKTVLITGAASGLGREMAIAFVENGTRQVLAIMAKQKYGKLITVASMFGIAAPAGLFPRPAYAASKGAVVNLARELAIQYALFNIQVNALCPGFFRTPARPRNAENAKLMAVY